jgi:hypothetical protein
MKVGVVFRAEVYRAARYIISRNALGCGFLWPFARMLQAIEGQFHSRRDSKLVKNMLDIIAHDEMLAHGWMPPTVVFASCFVTALCGALGLLIMRAGFSAWWSFAGFGLVAVFIAAVTRASGQTQAEDQSECGADRKASAST